MTSRAEVLPTRAPVSGIDVERLADIVAGAIKIATEPLRKRIEALEARPGYGRREVSVVSSNQASDTPKPAR